MERNLNNGTLGRLLLGKKRLLPIRGQGWGKFFLARDPGQKSYGRRRLLIGLCGVALLSIIYVGNATAWARQEYRPSYQESPLSPVATPLTSTITMTAPLLITVTDTVISPIATPVTAPLIVTETVPVTAAIVEPGAVPVVAPTVDLVNRGQTSLLLVGAVLVGLLLVVGLVIGRQR